jgi:DNA invertase Pin-like site-specific DNA recombinase
MKNVYGYIRVSTQKQGDGVSLEVQKEEIAQFATKNNLSIIKWFKEKKSASKGFRPQFNIMMANLQEDKADGFIAHKIDRMMRNRDDWASLNQLIDKGYEIHSAGESIDFSEPLGRLMADIQAAQATHYSFNLSREAKKGLYGRLKQGYYPFHAPLGYLNHGAGKSKTIDPIKAPLIKQLFKLYTSQGYTIRALVTAMYKRGLRNSRGKRLSKNSIISILKNPFYAGIMQIKGQQFKGNHTAIIKMQTYNRAQEIISGKTNTQLKKHNFLYRKLLTCKGCGYRLIGELQKGNIYYRCQTKGCSTKCIRESTINYFVKNMLATIRIGKAEADAMETILQQIQGNWLQKQKELLHSTKLRIGSLEMKLQRITDLLIEGVLDKDSYEMRKQEILASQQELYEHKNEISSKKTQFLKKMKDFLELAKNLILLYDSGNIDEKRELLEYLTSNLYVEGKKVMFSMVSPFYELANRDILSFGGGNKTTYRILYSKKVHTDIENGNIVYMDIKTSPIIPTPLDNIRCKEFFKHILSEAILTDVNPSNRYEIQTDHSGTQ